MREIRVAEPEIDGKYIARITAMVRTLTNAGSESADPLELFLREGARSLRPRFVYSTVLARSLGDRFVIESTVCDEVLATVTGSSMAQDVPGINRLQSLGIRSVISTPFQTAGSTYILSFVSLLSPADGFNRRDNEYVELMASILSLEVHRRWQAERVRFNPEPTNDQGCSGPMADAARAVVDPITEPEQAESIVAMPLTAAFGTIARASERDQRAHTCEQERT